MSKQTYISVATYADESAADIDWNALVNGSEMKLVSVVDAAIVERTQSDSVKILHRKTKHGWGKGAMVGAVLAALTPVGLVTAVAAGAVAGAGAASMERISKGLDKGTVEEIGTAIRRGTISMVVVTDADSVDPLDGLLAMKLGFTSQRTDIAEADLKGFMLEATE